MGVHLTTKQVMKYVPVLGQAISAGINFTAMKMIINAHINECYRVARAVIETNKVQPIENLK